MSLQETVQPRALAASHMDLLELSEGSMATVVVVVSYVGFSYFSFCFLISRNIRSCPEQQAEERIGLRTQMTSSRGAGEDSSVALWVFYSFALLVSFLEEAVP